MDLKEGDIVTVDFRYNNASNTFIFKRYIKDAHPPLVQLTHPLCPRIVIEYGEQSINNVGSILKDSTERSLDFAMHNKELLDYNTVADLEALCMYFVVTRKLTPKQKSILSMICGLIASIRFNNEIKDAMTFIVKNEGLLDDFNKMWYDNFSGLFKGRQNITSKKQRGSIFNIAGFVLAELENPSVLK